MPRKYKKKDPAIRLAKLMSQSCNNGHDYIEKDIYTTNGKSRVFCRACLRARETGKVLQSQLSKYDITVTEYDTMYDNQDGRCKICKGLPNGNRNRLSVDHDHSTGKVRGLLCNTCNTGLGMFRDNSELLIEAASYLNNT